VLSTVGITVSGGSTGGVATVDALPDCAGMGT